MSTLAQIGHAALSVVLMGFVVTLLWAAFHIMFSNPKGPHHE